VSGRRKLDKKLRKKTKRHRLKRGKEFLTVSSTEVKTIGGKAPERGKKFSLVGCS